MSEPVTKQRPMIDIDEFERRLRQPSAVQRRQNDNPLAELARLVHNDEDPYQNVFQDYPDQNYPGQNYPGQNYPGQGYPGDVVEDHRAPMRRVEPAMPRMPAAALLNQQRPAPRGFQAERVMPQAPNFQPQAPSFQPSMPMPDAPARAQNLGGNFAAIEAGLRGSFQPDFRQPDFRQPDFRGPAAAPPPPAVHEEQDDDDHWLDHAQASSPQASSSMPMSEPSARSHRLLYLSAAVILLGIGGIGATFAIKRTPESPQQIAMIKASTTPAKIQAPKPTDNNSLAMADASVLDKTPQPSPTGVVNRVEQPVDLSVTGPKPQTPPPAASAASVPVPTPPTESAPWQAPPGNVNGNPQVADASGSQAFGLDIKTRKVKTVTVRPDGSVVAEDPPADAAAPAQPVAAKPSAEAPKTAERSAPTRVASSEPTQAPNDVAADPSPASSRVGKPVRMANVDPAATDSDAEAGSGSSGFSVQLAAAPSAGEAEHVMNKLAQKYSATLSGHKLKFHRAKVNDKSVFRVRVGGLTKGGAVKLCEALKSKGGSCFIARD